MIINFYVFKLDCNYILSVKAQNYSKTTIQYLQALDYRLNLHTKIPPAKNPRNAIKYPIMPRNQFLVLFNMAKNIKKAAAPPF